MTEDVDGATLQPFLAACNQYPYHEHVAYACGSTINELKDFLQRGAVGGDDVPNLREFTREYCRIDADLAKETFADIRAQAKAGKANLSPLWKWFDTRWPCGSPLAISTLLAGADTETLSLEENFRDPNQEVRIALRRTKWFQADELDNPTAELQAELEARGYRRESDARPEPSPPPEG